MGLIVGLIALSIWLWRRPPRVEVVTRDHTTTVTVDRPVIQTREVVRYVADPEGAKALMAELEAAHADAILLHETIAKLEAQGSGSVVYVDRPVPGTTQTVREAHFVDWRLRFDAIGDQASYALTQTFEAQAIFGRNSTGQPTGSVRLYEIGPGETRTPLDVARTTIVAATPSASRWRVGFALQAGAAATLAGWHESVQAGAVAGVAWLRRGSSGAAEDNTVAIGTPVIYLGGSSVEPGLLPVSINLGRLPRQPLRDVWLSPLVTPHRAGLALTATF